MQYAKLHLKKNIHASARTNIRKKKKPQILEKIKDPVVIFIILMLATALSILERSYLKLSYKHLSLSKNDSTPNIAFFFAFRFAL